MPQETKSHAEVGGSGGGSDTASLAGFSADLADDATRFDVLEKAFDYRGDVALTLVGGAKVEGYLFDRRRGKGAEDSYIRVMAAQGGEKVKVPYHAVARIEFSTRDPAAGKSFETWVKKYIEKKTRGEAANLESESLD
jgi:hypothetical protein